jgi:Uma2 family endonuclease
MATLVSDSMSVRIPKWVVNLKSFLRWAESDDFPEEGRICFLQGDVWVDMSMEQVFTHTQIKGELNTVIGSLVKQQRSGLYLPDGLRLNNVSADISAVPDATFISNETLRSRRAKFVKGKKRGFTALAGSPDLVIEIVSDSSVDKDTEWLMAAYWNAGIPEYWLIDAREEPLRFDVWRHGPKGYVLIRKQAGWVKSAVLGKAFRLTQQENELGLPEFDLAVR